MDRRLLLVFGVILLAYLGAEGYLDELKFSMGNVGLSTISITQPHFISNDQFYSQGAYQITAVATGSGKYLETTLSPEDSMALFGVRTSQPAKITVEVIKDDCRYQFNNVSYPVYDYTIWRSKAHVSGPYIVCDATTANPSFGSSYFISHYGTYLSTTPIRCASDCHAYAPSGMTRQFLGGCDSVWRKQIGVIYKTDPGAKFYDYAVRINMTLGNRTYSATLDKANKSISTGLATAMTEAFRAESLFAGKGDQDCPSPGDTDVAIYVSNTQTTNPLKYISGFQADNVIRTGQGIVDLNTALASGESYNTQVQIAIASTPNVGQYLSFATTPATTIRTAAFSLTPATSVSIPFFNLYINAETIGVHVPSGQPKILNVSAGRVYSATRSEVKVTAMNEGEGDAFDFDLKCAKDLNPFTTRANIGKGETKEVLVNYEGAGIIGDCTVTMKSVNSPDKTDTETVKLSIYPFCGRGAPSPAHEPVFTEFGCAYICPNYEDGYDVLDSSCQHIESYDRCAYNDAGDCVARISYAGAHCTGIGTSKTTNNYMDGVFDGHFLPFTPEVVEHRYFITTVDGTPVCDYVDEYGYKDGQPVAELEFDYSKGYPQASGEFAEPDASLTADVGSAGETIKDTVKEAMGIDLVLPGVFILGLLAIGGFAFWKFVLRR